MTAPNVQQLALEMVEQEMSWLNDGDHWTRLCILRALRSAIVRHRVSEDTFGSGDYCDSCITETAMEGEIIYHEEFPCPELQEIVRKLGL